MNGSNTRKSLRGHNPMLNVLSIVPYSFLPARFGGTISIARFNNYFSKQVNLVCVSTKSNDTSLAKGYELLNILSNSQLRYINLFYFFRLRSIIRRRKITHLLIEHPYYGWLGILLKRSTGVQLVVHSHNMEGLRRKSLGRWWWKLLWRYEKRVHRAADFSFFIQENDRQYAIEHFELSPSRCGTVTYGIDLDAPPAPAEKARAKEWVHQQHAIPPGNNILLFNGSFDYMPNLEGLNKIINLLNPALQQLKDFAYTIIICGKDIPVSISSKQYPNMIIAGYVDDILIYNKGADIFLNPVIEGGGIKTKLVDALGYDMHAVSTESGAIGVDPKICNEKLAIAPDGDWIEFTRLIIRQATLKNHTPAAFYAQFYWGTITANAARFIQTTNHPL
jgi:polysaccharide biosynthesis protein PslH